MSYDPNPRFPHKFSVLRPRRVNGEVVFDSSGDVEYDTLQLVPCATYDGDMLRDSDGAPITLDAVDILSCGYRTSQRNVREAGDVVVNTLVLHTPPFITPLEYGDILEITDYERTYRATVVRKVLFNYGANIWFDEIHN